MKTYVYFSMPGHGHTNPTLGVIKELVKRGNKVIYYSIEGFRTKIEATGAEFRSYPEELIFDPRISKDIGIFGLKIVQVAHAIIPAILKNLSKDKPDCIMYDALAVTGKAIASVFDVPSIAFFTFLAFNRHVERKYISVYVKTVADAVRLNRILLKALYLYNKLSKMYKFKRATINEFMLNTGGINIVFTSSYFQPCASTFNNTYKFIGTSISERHEKITFLNKIPKNKKIIYIAVGTIFNDNLSEYHMYIDAFKNTDYVVIMSIGHRFNASDFKEIPQNFIVQSHIPQLEVLQMVDVFVSHAGLNSVCESLYYGVPMILMPRIHEQQINAMRVAELGAGIYLKKLTAPKLYEAVKKVLTTESYATQAHVIKDSLRLAGGYKKAVDEIVDFAEQQAIETLH